MLTRKCILGGCYRRPLSNQTVEYGIDLRMRMREQALIGEETIANSVSPESAVYERLAERVWYKLYGELLGPIHELIAAASRRGPRDYEPHGDGHVAAEQVLNLLKYR